MDIYEYKTNTQVRGSRSAKTLQDTQSPWFLDRWYSIYRDDGTRVAIYFRPRALFNNTQNGGDVQFNRTLRIYQETAVPDSKDTVWESMGADKS